MTAPTPDRLRVLLVEDNPADARLIRELLRESHAVSCELHHVDRLGAVPAALESRELDVVLLDLSLPDAHGMDTVARMRALAPRMPIVVLTGTSDQALALQAVQAGAQDYLVKGEMSGDVICRALRYAIERHRLLEEARHASRLRDEVLAIVSHDLRNPLSTVAMCAGALMEHPAPPARSVAELAGTIQESVGWAQRIIQDLLDVASIEAGRLRIDREPVAPAVVLEQARELFAPLAAERSLRLEVAPAGELPRIRADAARVLQVLGNLLGNAIKFTPPGGHIEVGAAPAGDHAVEFLVRDSGPGIPAADHGRLFDRFWQAAHARRAGAGLGLAIARGIVEAHEGRIWVESEPGRGTTMRFTVPMA